MGKLIDEEIFKFVKNSVKNVPEKDREWVSDDLLDYIDMTSSNNDDMYFYDMMKAIRFTYEPDTIAYTKEDGRIYLSCPGNIVGKSERQWDFTYDHECLHQLWETFDVAKEIQSKGIEYNHELLNIASDCVINDYLRDIRGKTPPKGIIFPEDIEKEFGVKYDRKNDTQFSLYLKILKTGKKPSSNMSNSANSEGKGGQGQSSGGSQSSSVGQGGQSGQSGQQGGSQQGGGQAGGQSGQSGQSGQHKDIDKMSKDEAKASAQGDAKRAQDAADKAKDKYGAGSDEAKKAQEAADKAKAAADKAKRARSENGARKAAKEAEAAANEAEKAAGENGNSKSKQKGQDHNQSGGDWGSGTYTGGDEAETDLDDLERKSISDITSDIKKTVTKYANRISGDFGNFVRKCKISKEMRESGLAVNVNKAKANWKQATYRSIDAYINNLVFQKKREWKRTYSRPKRGSGIVKMGEPIEMGRIRKEDKLDIPMAFYIDKSGSMYSTIDHASKAMYGIAQDIKKRWYSDKIIGEMDFRFFAFDTRMHELRVGQVPNASNDNMSLAEILGFIATRPKKDLINIIITDGKYPINDAEMASYFKDYEGMMVMVINNVNRQMQDLEKKFKGKFIYVQADNEFSL